MIERLREWAKAHRATLDLITKILIISTIVIWIVWDVFVGAVGATTESRILTNWSYKTVALPYAVGALCGHWWAYWRGKLSPYIMWKTALFFSLLAVVILWDLVTWKWGCPPLLMKLRYAGYWPVIGFPIGHFFWGQRGTGPVSA